MSGGEGEGLREEWLAEGEGEEFIASFTSDLSHWVRLTHTQSTGHESLLPAVLYEEVHVHVCTLYRE